MGATHQVEAIVLRSVRYGEADAVLALQTLERGRVSAFAKGIRRPASRLRGRLQPGACAAIELVLGRGELATVRGAHVLEPNAGLWAEGYRLAAASSVLEAALRLAPEEEPNPAAYHLLRRGLALLAAAQPGAGPARLDPLVLSLQLKLVVAAGLLPELARCVACGAAGPLSAFSARLGGALCDGCRGSGEPLPGAVHAALAGLAGRPLAEAAEACPAGAAAGVERVLGLVVQEHLGVRLRSATPL